MRNSSSFSHSRRCAALAWLLTGWPLVAAAQSTAVPSGHSAPACLPATTPRTGIPRIPATIEPPGTVAPIVRPLENLTPLSPPPAAMTELPAVPTIATGPSTDIEDRIRELRGKLTRRPPAAEQIPQPPAASPPAPMTPADSAAPSDAVFPRPSDVPPSPPPIPSEGGDPLARPPGVPLGEQPAKVVPAPAPQQSITAHSLKGLDRAGTTLEPPPPPPVVDEGGRGLFPGRSAGAGSPVVPPSPPVTEINSSSISALSIPVEILRSPIDHISLADNLYAAKSYGLALEAYQAAAKASISPPDRRWANFQTANCYRLLGQPAEAERQYRRLAGDRDGGQFSELSRWWLQSMDQKSQLSAQLEQLRGAMESANAAAAAAAGIVQEAPSARSLPRP